MTLTTIFRRSIYCFISIAASLSIVGCSSSAPRLKGAEAYFEEGQKSLEKKRCVEAIEKFQRLVNNFPGSRLAPDAQYYLAEAYFCSEDFVNAVFEYQRLLDTYPSSQWLDDAQFKIGESYFQQLRRPELDQKETYEALNYFRYFIEDNPTSPLTETARQRIVDCRGRLAKKHFLNGRLYQRQGHLDAAVLTYEDVVRTYPDTPWYYHTLLQLGEIAWMRDDLSGARGYWEEVLSDSEEKELQEKVRKKLEKMQVAGEE
jgi:outer membrane protein assembly factor BamD